MAQRDVEIDFMSYAYKVLMKQISEKLFFLMLHWEIFYHYLPTMLIGRHGRSCACVWAPISIEKRWVALMFS